MKRLDFLEKVVLRARACLDSLRQNLTTENQKIIGAFYSIIAPLRTKDTAKKMHGPIGKMFELFGLKQAYSKTKTVESRYLLVTVSISNME